jgi:hypothetical protein
MMISMSGLDCPALWGEKAKKARAPRRASAKPKPAPRGKCKHRKAA